MWQKILDSLKSFLFNFLKSAVKTHLQILMPIAQDVVRQVAADPSMVTSSDKRNAAFDMIGARIAEKEKDISSSLINLGIELAYQEFKLLSGGK